MIRRTFQFIPGVGPWMERDLWARGILDWSFFPDAGPAVLSGKQDALARQLIHRADEALAARDLPALVELFPKREHWRLYDAFAADAVFFDIETDGSTPQVPTVVALFSARRGLELFLAGRNLERLPAALAEHPVWVTFNGSLFDVPVLKQHFGAGFPRPQLHLDARFICQKFGMKGGLKRIEAGLGLERPAHIRGVTGADAVILWREHLASGRGELLRFLVEYNLYDAFQLRTLMDLIWNSAVTDAGEPPAARRVPFDRESVMPALDALLATIHPEPLAPAELERIRHRDTPRPSGR